MSGVEEQVFSQAVEDYVKAIFKLQQEEETVSTTALAQRIGTTPAAASKMLKHLSGLKLVHYTRYYGARLTEDGERVALEVIRHHRLLELYLHQALGLSWDRVHEEAEVLEHHLSEALESRIAEVLGHPDVDLHGSPIPTPEGTIAPLRGLSLADTEPGQTVTIVRVRDSNPDALRYLDRIGIRLQATLSVSDKQPFNGPLTLVIDDVPCTIGRELAGHVFVEVLSRKE